MFPDKFASALKNSALPQFGDVILFGSFVTTEGRKFNDIDIYIDTDLENFSEIENKIAEMSGYYFIGPNYYSSRPKPGKAKNNAELGKLSGFLHVTVCPRKMARNHDFYSSMISRKHIILPAL